MYWDAKNVTPLPDYKLLVELVDGRKGVFDVGPYLDIPAFLPLRDVARFSQVGIQLGAITWPGGQDIAPDTLIAELTEVEATP